MAIIRTDLDKLPDANAVEVDSDAPDNMQAIHEIDDWAAEHGFARVSEYWLRQRKVNGRRVFRGICYRLSEDEVKAIGEESAHAARVTDSLPTTIHQVDEDRK